MTALWLSILLLLILGLWEWISSKRCGRHGRFGRCKLCAQEVEEKFPAEARTVADMAQRRTEIEAAFQSINPDLRDELTVVVKERMEREYLLGGEEALKLGMVRLYRKRQR